MTNKEQENKKILKGEEQGNIESPPDPKTVSNATRVDEWVDANGVRHTAADRNKQKKNTNSGDNDEDVDELPPSSDQPEELEDKEEKQESQKGAGMAPQENKKESDNKKSDNKKKSADSYKVSDNKSVETKTTVKEEKK